MTLGYIINDTYLQASFQLNALFRQREIAWKNMEISGARYRQVGANKYSV